MINCKCLIMAFFPPLFAMQQPDPSQEDHAETAIIYKMLVTSKEMTMEIHDTIFLYGHFALEPVYEINTASTIFIDTNTNEQKPGETSITENLIAYHITDLNRKVGMAFDPGTPPAFRRRFSITDKKIGFQFTDEPFLQGSELPLEKMKNMGDTVVAGQLCTIYSYAGNRTMTMNGITDTVYQTRIFLNKTLRYHFPFISKKIADHFGAAIIMVESKFVSGTTIKIQFDYRDGFSKPERMKMKELLAAYNKHQ